MWAYMLLLNSDADVDYHRTFDDRIDRHPCLPAILCAGLPCLIRTMMMCAAFYCRNQALPDGHTNRGDGAAHGTDREQAGGEEEGLDEDAYRECIAVVKVRRGCGDVEGRKWIRTLRTLGGKDTGTLLPVHESELYWAKSFGLSPKICQDMAASALACRQDAG